MRASARMVPVWPWSSWLASQEPREVPLALISPPLASQPGEAAPEEVFASSASQGSWVFAGEDGP